MLTFQKGTGGGAGASRAMAEYWAENTLPENATAMADYWLRGVTRSEQDSTAAIPRQNMAPHVAAGLALDSARTATIDEVTNLLRGLRADGAEIVGRPNYGARQGRDQITYVDFTFSAPKSVSIAMALAPTDAERAMIVGAHRDAWMAAMEHLESIIGVARKGAGGSKGSIPGKIGWVSYDHYTARPSIKVPHTEADGTKTTLMQTVHNRKVAADMQLHTHVATPTAVFADDGTIGSIDSLAMHERVLEVGAYYQAHLATNLRSMAIDVVLDDKTELARLTAVPETIIDLFSKRKHDGEAEARNLVKEMGKDWDSLSSLELVGLMRRGTHKARQNKDTSEVEGDVANWTAQAKAAGYEHKSIVDPALKGGLPSTEQDRLTRGYLAALPVLEKQLSKRATMYGSVTRVAAARGLIASGVESARDIDRITAAMREHGVRQDGEQVPLMWAKVATVDEEAPEGGRISRFKITTTKHVAMEREAMALALAASQDTTGSLTTGQIDRGARDVTERDGLDFTSDHGRRQRLVMEAIGTAGRFVAAVGIAGSGKSTLLRPLVQAWSAPAEHAGDERTVYGTALSTRQAEALADAGIAKRNTMPISALIGRATAGEIVLDKRSVVVIDELSQVGTAQVLGLLRLREQLGFTIAAIGDDKQGQSIEAGSTVKLARLALGQAAVPELESSVRQLKERDRQTALLFRNGSANGGIDRLREDGRAVLVQGGHSHAVAAVADLWQSRLMANADRPDYTLTISAPTNSDARAIGAAIRERRRGMGAVGPDLVVVKATDQNQAEYDLPLAVGDRVRLFSSTRAAYPGKPGNMGNNGSVVEVESIDKDGLQLRNHKGNSGFVTWDTLRDPASGRVRLTYGDVLSIDAIQGVTSTEHIDAMPSGSAAVNSYKSYVAKSRSREATWMVVSDGQERSEVISRRALGNNEPVTEAQVWANVGRNLSRQPEKELAVELLDRAHVVQTGLVRSMATAFQPIQQRGSDGPTYAASQPAAKTAEAAPAMQAAAAGKAAQTRNVVRAMTGAQRAEERRQTQAARRSMRAPSQRPRQEEAISPTTIKAIPTFAGLIARRLMKRDEVMDSLVHGELRKTVEPPKNAGVVHVANMVARLVVTGLMDYGEALDMVVSKLAAQNGDWEAAEKKGAALLEAGLTSAHKVEVSIGKALDKAVSEAVKASIPATQADREAGRNRIRSGPADAGQDTARAAQEAARRAQERGLSNGPHL